MQRTLPEVYKHNRAPYDQNSTFNIKANTLFARFIIADLQPLDITSSQSLQEFLSHLDDRYKLPARRTLMEKVITPMYISTKAFLMKIMLAAPSVDIPTDLWESCAQTSYMSFTAHIVNE